MNEPHSDALVFFGATGDLAYKKIFPALQAMVKRGTLDVPVIGVAKAGWNLDQLRARARDSVEKHGGLDPTAFDKLNGCCATSTATTPTQPLSPTLQKELGRQRSGRRTISRFRRCCSKRSWSSSRASGCATGARVIVEKPFGHDLASARELNAILHASFTRGESSASTTTSASGRCTTCCSSGSPTRFWSRSGTASTSRASQITMAEDFGVQGRGAFYDKTGAIRDVIQNHLFQVLCEPGDGAARECGRRIPARREGQGAEAIPPIEQENVVRGQFRGYLEEPGVAKDSKTETFAALRLESTRGGGRACRSTFARASRCR